MRLLMIRHGESVDNAAGLYAGSRDSPLTNHGVLQAQSLGAHLACRRPVLGPIVEVFASNLQRALKTAEAVVEAQQSTLLSSVILPKLQIQVVLELREKDFGSDEGTSGSRKRQRDGLSKLDALYVPPESYTSMQTRAKRFIDEHLVPSLERCLQDQGSANKCIAVVAHGMILHVLLRMLLLRYDVFESSMARSDGSKDQSDRLAVWSNTGYLELEVSSDLATPFPILAAPSAMVNESEVSSETTPHKMQTSPVKLRMKIVQSNCVAHLQKLKKSRGGLGSVAFDKNQRTVDSFFKNSPKNA